MLPSVAVEAGKQRKETLKLRAKALRVLGRIYSEAEVRVQITYLSLAIALEAVVSCIQIMNNHFVWLVLAACCLRGGEEERQGHHGGCDARDHG